jgi:hypothetical protein
VTDLDNARHWLARAVDALDDRAPAGTEYAHAAAQIGSGYAVLADIESRGPVPTYVQIRPIVHDPADPASLQRAAQAADEAQPHDDEPKTCSFHVLDGRRCTLTAGHPLRVHRLEDGTEADTQGRTIDRTRFLGFTSHGHPVDCREIPEGIEAPDLVARCGGPAICAVCARDAEAIRGEATR